MRCPQYHGRKRRRRSNNAALPDAARRGVAYAVNPDRSVKARIPLETWSLKEHATDGPVTVAPARGNVTGRGIVLKLWHKAAMRRVDGVTVLSPAAQGPIVSRATMPEAPRTLCAVPRRDAPRSRNDTRWYDFASGGAKLPVSTGGKKHWSYRAKRYPISVSIGKQ